MATYGRKEAQKITQSHPTDVPKVSQSDTNEMSRETNLFVSSSFFLFPFHPIVCCIRTYVRNSSDTYVCTSHGRWGFRCLTMIGRCIAVGAQLHRRTYVRTYVRMRPKKHRPQERPDGQTDRRATGRTDGQTNRRTDG